MLDVTANSSKKFIVSVHDVTKVNIPHSLDDDMLTHGHEEADTLIPLHIIDTIRHETFKEIHVRCSDTDVFTFLMDLDANGYLGTLTKLIMLGGVGAKYREIDIRERVNAVGKTKSAALVGLHEISVSDWGGKFVGVSKKSWTESFMALSDDDPIIESLTFLGSKPIHNDDLAEPEFKDLERFVCQVYSKSGPYYTGSSSLGTIFI